MKIFNEEQTTKPKSAGTIIYLENTKESQLLIEFANEYAKQFPRRSKAGNLIKQLNAELACW